VVRQCPCGTAATKRSPRGARPCVRAMFVAAQVSSRKTSLCASSFGRRAAQAARASATSARSCSAARRRFFARQAQPGQRRPHDRMADRNAVGRGQPSPQFGHRGVRLGRHPRPQGVVQLGEPRRDVVALRPRRRVATVAQPRPRLHHVGRAHPEPRGHLARRPGRRQDAVAQVLPVGLPPAPTHRSPPTIAGGPRITPTQAPGNHDPIPASPIRV
jgi:hypothetical protein